MIFRGRMQILGIMVVVVAASLVLPFIPLSKWYYPLFGLVFIYGLVFGIALDLKLTAFLLIAVLSILIGNPSPVFKSWERLFAFVLVVGVLSPFMHNYFLRRLRRQLFSSTLITCSLVSIGSFIGFFMGINLMGPGNLEPGVGTFGGLTTHSMILGPVSGISFCFLFWRICAIGMSKREFIIHLIALFASFASLLLAASRGAFGATMIAVFVMLYKLKKQRIRKFVQLLLGFVVVLFLISPVLMPFADNLIKKQTGNIEMGGATASRDEKWRNRLDEFESNPVLGVGFAAVDTKYREDYNANTGVVEFGSSWLGILSMTGIGGFIIFLSIFMQYLYKLFVDKTCVLSALLLGILVFFAIHMVVEGYVLAAGSYLFFLLWLSLGTVHAMLYDRHEDEFYWLERRYLST